MEQLQPPFVFLSYATPDRPQVRKVRGFLQSNGINAWLDEENLRGGQRWELEIQRALDAADLVVLLISPASMDRNGFYHREIGMVLERAQRRPSGRVFPIPVLLDADMKPPEQVGDLHCIRLAGQEGWDRLLRDVRDALGQREQVRETKRHEVGIDWSFHSMEEKWDGLPGYEAEISWPEYRSTRYPLITHVSDAIRSEMQMMLAGERAVKLDQQPDLHSFGQEKVLRTNALSITLEDPLIKHRVLTQYASVYGYGAGAIHGFHGPRSWVFVLEPLVRIARLETIFQDSMAAFPVLQAEARTRLFSELEAVDPSETEDMRAYRMEWITSGTVDWNAFSCFGLEPAGVGLRLPPYQVTAYAFGTVSVLIPYSVVKEFLRRPYFDALGLSYAFDEADVAAPAEADADAASWPLPSADGAGDWWK